MSQPELGALLADASEHLAERDFVDLAWQTAFATQRRRRRGWTGAGSVAVLAALAVVAVQAAGGHGTVPAPRPSPTTSASRTLADGTAYAQLPLEGRESELTYFAAGLPTAIDLDGPAVALSPRTAPRGPLAAVYLRATGAASYEPVLLPVTGRPVVADRLNLASGAGADPTSLLGPRAIDAEGRFVLLAQPGRVVRLDARSGATTSYAVPSQRLREVGWGTDGLVVARDDQQTWTIDPASNHPVARPAASRGIGQLLLSTGSGGLLLRRGDGAPDQRGQGEQRVHAPVTQLSGTTVSTDQRAASVAYFDQDLTHPVIQRGNGPIDQGLVSVDAETGAATVLLAPESPDGQTGRLSPCCSVLGWADATTVLFVTAGRHGRWVLAWNTATGQVYEAVRLLTRAPDEPVVPVAVRLGGP